MWSSRVITKNAIVKHRTSFISGSAYPSTPNTGTVPSVSSSASSSDTVSVGQSHPLSFIMCATSIMYLPSLYFWLDSNACS